MSDTKPIRRKKTDGERIADKWIDERGEGIGLNADPEELAKDINRIIRRRQKEAWKAGYNFREVIAELDKEDGR